MQLCHQSLDKQHEGRDTSSERSEMELLRTNHLEGRNVTDDSLLPGELTTVQPIIFDVIDDRKWC